MSLLGHSLFNCFFEPKVCYRIASEWSEYEDLKVQQTLAQTTDSDMTDTPLRPIIKKRFQIVFMSELEFSI
jgi:hypothetical protein